ncbi:WD40/YVTN/BNR-like repeat-containing protein [candidate division KSB1 bacterium]
MKKTIITLFVLTFFSSLIFASPSDDPIIQRDKINFVSILRSSVRNFDMSKTDPNILIVSTGSKLLKTEDSGENWTELSPGSNIGSVMIDENDPNIIYCSRSGSRVEDAVLKSVDGGLTWEDMNMNSRLLFMSKHNNIVYFVYRDEATGNPKLMVSKDNGETWEDDIVLSPNIFPKTVTIDKADNSIIYVVVNEQYGTSYRSRRDVILKSTNGGRSWDKIYTSRRNSINLVFIDPVDHNVIYFSAGHGLFKSTDAGLSWDKIFASRCARICLTRAGEIYATTSKGIAFSKDAGDDWDILIKNDRAEVFVGTGSATFEYIAYNERDGLLYVSSYSINGLLKIKIK